MRMNGDQKGRAGKMVDIWDAIHISGPSNWQEITYKHEVLGRRVEKKLVVRPFSYPFDLTQGFG